MITTVEQFIDQVAALRDIRRAYDLFEYETVDSVRGEIYAFADPASPEPFRSAMNNMGFDSY